MSAAALVSLSLEIDFWLYVYGVAFARTDRNRLRFLNLGVSAQDAGPRPLALL
jgi:hypothetical protein